MSSGPDTCSGTQACDGNGACRRKLGESCGLGSECVSGHCVDQVCCDTDCRGTCRSCKLSGSQGTCSLVAQGDPDGECIGPDKACGGECNGKGECDFPGIGKLCGECKACDGTGRCNKMPSDDDSCGIIDCDDLDNTCRDYADLDAERCAAFGKCKVKNDPATCTKFTTLGSCGDAGGSNADGGTSADGGSSSDSGGGCAVSRPGALVPELMWLLLLLGLLVGRSRRRPHALARSLDGPRAMTCCRGGAAEHRKCQHTPGEQ